MKQYLTVADTVKMLERGGVAPEVIQAMANANKGPVVVKPTASVLAPTTSQQATPPSKAGAQWEKEQRKAEKRAKKLAAKERADMCRAIFVKPVGQMSSAEQIILARCREEGVVP